MHASRFWLSALAILAQMACSFSPIKKTKSTDQIIESFNLLAVRFVTPDDPAARADDFTHPARALACRPAHELWKEYLQEPKLTPLLHCLNQAGKTAVATAHYLYIPKTKPYLAPNPAQKEGPACLYALLPQIPLPREVYFLGKTALSRDEQCYAMSFDGEANQIADTELRAPRFEVDFHFPLLRPLKSSQDREIWFLVSTLSLFEEEKIFKASYVPESVEQACFKTDPLFEDKKSGKIPPVFWP